MISLEELKEKVQDLPPLPELAVRLMRMCQDPEVPPREIVEIIKHDPSITMKVLRLCNSPFYGLPRQITSLQEAMIYIGTDALVNFVLAGCLASYCQDDIEGYGLAQGELWRHSVGTAICSQKVAEHAESGMAGIAFTCGLLLNIGKIILNTYAAEAFPEMLELVEKKGLSFLDAEKQILGYTHAETGGAVAAHWNLPAEIIDAIRYQYNPVAAEEHKRLVSIVHVGNILCISFGIGVGSDGLAYIFHPGAIKVLGLKIEDLFALSVEIHDQFKAADELLSLT